MHAFLEHLKTMGAVVDGQHSMMEIETVERQLQIELPEEFRSYFISFQTCKFPSDCIWEFFDLPTCVDRTMLYRQHYRSIKGMWFDIPIHHIFAFCDALIDAPTYFVVACPESPLFGAIVGSHADEGWLVGRGLNDFLAAFKREWKGAVISNE